MREVLPGVFEWSVMHEPIGVRVSSHYVAPAGIVIDPKLPEGGFDELPGAPQQVVLTSGLHHRDAQAFADEYGIPIRASREAAERLGDRLQVEQYTEGDEIAPGVTAIKVGAICPDDDALHIAVADGAIAFADALNRYGEQLAFFADSLLGEDPETVKTQIKQRLQGLLTRDFDHLLFAHGEPLIGGGKDALRRFAAST
jgi:hypothetical protein